MSTNTPAPQKVSVQSPEPLRSYPDLTGLSEAEREVYVSVEIEGLRPVELAPYTEWSASTIRTLLSRAREKKEER